MRLYKLVAVNNKSGGTVTESVLNLREIIGGGPFSNYDCERILLLEKDLPLTITQSGHTYTVTRQE